MFIVTVQANNGSGGTESFAYDTDTEKFYSDLTRASEITTVSVPTRDGFVFQGLYSSVSGGTQYVDSNGTINESLYDRAWSKNITVYAQWQRICYVLTLDDNGGSGGPGAIYYKISGGGWYSDSSCTHPISVGDTLAEPTRTGKKCVGYYDYSSGTRDSTTRIIGINGEVRNAISDLTLSTDLTYTAYWYNVYTVTLDDGSGEGGPGEIYYCNAGGTKWCSDKLCRNPISSLADLPEYKYRRFNGYYSASSSGTQYIDGTGAFASGMPSSITADATWYAQYTRISYRIKVDANGGSPNRCFYTDVSSSGKFYKDWKLTTEITNFSELGSFPQLECYKFYGASANESGGTKYIFSTGAFSSNLTSLTFTGNITIYVQWTFVSYKITINKDGGTGGTDALYVKYESTGGNCSTLYADDQCTTQTSNVTLPTKAGYACNGVFSAKNQNGTKYIADDGHVMSTLKALTINANLTIYAGWNVQTYLLSFDLSGGTCTAATARNIQTGDALGTLPVPTNTNGKFKCWQIDGKTVTASSTWTYADNKTAVAVWIYYFGNLTDYFGLSNNFIMLVASESGTGRQVTNLWNGAYEQGAELLNPVCTYRVKASGAVGITLGQAFGAGYMITEAEYKTGADQEPTLTVRGVANEGANAINQYAVTFNVDPDHVAQDPFGAIDDDEGGGELVEMTSAAVCDAVVPYEDNKPCASDVVHGRERVTGRTAAYFGESAPTFRNSFIDSGVPVSECDVDFVAYAFAAERKI